MGEGGSEQERGKGPGGPRRLLGEWGRLHPGRQHGGGISSGGSAAAGCEFTRGGKVNKWGASTILTILCKQHLCLVPECSLPSPRRPRPHERPLPVCLPSPCRPRANPPSVWARVVGTRRGHGIHETWPVAEHRVFGVRVCPSGPEAPSWAGGRGGASRRTRAQPGAVTEGTPGPSAAPGPPGLPDAGASGRRPARSCPALPRLLTGIYFPLCSRVSVHPNCSFRVL